MSNRIDTHGMNGINSIKLNIHERGVKMDKNEVKRKCQQSAQLLQKRRRLTMKFIKYIHFSFHRKNFPRIIIKWFVYLSLVFLWYFTWIENNQIFRFGFYIWVMIAVNFYNLNQSDEFWTKGPIEEANNSFLSM